MNNSTWSGTLNHPTNPDKVYFFRGSQYYRYDWKADKVDSGYPKNIGGIWSGLPNDLDAALNHPTNPDKVYFFQGSQYYRYDWKADKVDSGYPLDVKTHWKGLCHDVLKIEHMTKSWISNLSDGKRLLDLCIPGSHDSATYNVKVPFVNTQSDSISDQLNMGIRFFDFRLSKVTPNIELGDLKVKSAYALMHGKIPLGLDFFNDGLRVISKFLQENSREVIFVSIKSENSILEITDDDIDDLLSMGTWIDSNNKAMKDLTLEDCRGNVVFLNRINSKGYHWSSFNIQDEYKLPIGYHEQVIVPHITERTQRVCVPNPSVTDFFRVKCWEQVIVPEVEERTQRVPWGFDYNHKSTAVRDFLKEESLNPDELNICFLSATGGGSAVTKVLGDGIVENAKRQNAIIGEYAKLSQGCIFPMDFPSEDTISKIINMNSN
ncbi:MAG: hemopexin repeat-containing protein [Mariprofundaceae bacterium]|nr:hemopexin repeat-containing protein [Mariprofundaceae bacterium]